MWVLIRINQMSHASVIMVSEKCEITLHSLPLSLPSLIKWDFPLTLK